jgi:hypothetical protein
MAVHNRLRQAQDNQSGRRVQPLGYCDSSPIHYSLEENPENIILASVY